MDRLEYFKNLLEKTPDNPMVHYSLALEYYKMQDYHNTINHLRTRAQPTGYWQSATKSWENIRELRRFCRKVSRTIPVWRRSSESEWSG